MKSRKIKKKYLNPISEDDICQDVIMTKYELIFVWSEKTDIFISRYIYQNTLTLTWAKAYSK